MGVGVTFHHRERLVPANPLDCRKVYASLNQMRNRGVAQCVPHDLPRIQTSRRHDAAERLSNIHSMPAASGG